MHNCQLSQKTGGTSGTGRCNSGYAESVLYVRFVLIRGQKSCKDEVGPFSRGSSEFLSTVSIADGENRRDAPVDDSTKACRVGAQRRTRC